MGKNRFRSLPAITGMMLATVLMLGVFGFQAAPAEAQTFTYDRAAAVAWARANVNNSGQGTCLGDLVGCCTGLVGGALQAGGISDPDISRNSYGNHQLISWMVENQSMWEFRPINELEPGDFILYSRLSNIPDWAYIDSGGSQWTHSALYIGNNQVHHWNFSSSVPQPHPANLWNVYPTVRGVHILAGEYTSSPVTTQTSFDFSDSLHGWIAANDLEGQKVLEVEGGMWAAITDTDNSGHLDPYFISPEFAPFRADSFTHLRIRMGRDVPNSTCMEVFWSRPGQAAFTGEQRVQYTSLVDGTTRTYEIDLTQNPQWSRLVDRLRIDPGCQFGGSTQEGFVRIDSIELFDENDSEAVPTYSWNFKLDVPQGWVPKNHLTGVKMEPTDGGMWAQITGDNPQFFGPRFEQPINAADYGEVRITMGRDGADNCSQFFWRYAGEGQGFVGSQRIDFDVDGNGVGTYVLNLTNHPLWTGQISKLRVDPACGAPTPNGNNAVRIDRIELVPVAQSNPDTFQLTFSPPSATMAIGETANLNLLVENPDMQTSGGIRGLDVQCEPTASIVQGVSIEDGALFSNQAVSVLLPEPAFPPGPGFQWMVSERADEANVTTTGTALSVTYQGAAAGTAEVICNADIIDADGALVEDVPVASAVLEVLGNATVQGIVMLDSADDYSGVEITFYDDDGEIAATTTSAADGTFSVELAPGTYYMVMETPGYLSAAEYDISASTDATLPEVTLVGGDVNGDEIIDLLDVTQFANDYAAQQSATTLDYDITRNGSVDLGDFYGMVNNLDKFGAFYTPGSN